MPTYYTDTLDSPIGPLRVTVDDNGALVSVAFGTRMPRGKAAASDPARCADVVRQLGEYFAGQRRAFDVGLAPEGSAFEQQVWAALTEIPYGTTTSYGALAKRIGGTANARDVGSANGRNPIAIVVPCHRVIGADGSLVGYGGGLERKSWLLAHEGALLL